MKKALVEPSGRIAQIAPVNPDPASNGVPFPVAPPLQWIDCDDSVTTNYTWNGTAIIAPPAAAQPSHNDIIDAQITAAEAALPITPRALREFMLLTLQFAHVDPSVNPKFAAAAALDAQIQVLRAQRT